MMHWASRVFGLEVEDVDMFWLHSSVDEVLDQVLAKEATAANNENRAANDFRSHDVGLGRENVRY
jgi:hypothetical protein